MLVCPALRNPVSQRGRLYSQHARQIGQPHLFAEVSHNTLARDMCRLFKRGRPTAIARLIGSSAVDTIQSFTCWAFAHIRQKVSKLLPSGTHGNAFSSVIREATCPRVLAALLHHCPCRVGATQGRMGRMPMFAGICASRTGARTESPPSIHQTPLCGFERLAADRTTLANSRDLFRHAPPIVHMYRVCNQIKAGGKVMAGLIRRRAAEAELYRS